MTSLNKKTKVNIKDKLFKIIAYTILITFFMIFVVPFIFALITSFTSPINIFDFSWIPNPIDIANYTKLFSEHQVIRALINTFLYIIPPVFVGIFTSAMAAYAFAKLRFKGKNVVFYMLLSTMVIPGVITMIPSYVLFTNIYGWNGTPLPLIVPGMFGSALTMFFFRQYFLTLPKELEEAAQIDGMHRFGIFTKIILPLSKPVIITQIILSLNGAYNDYLSPLLYVGNEPKLYTIQLLISGLQTSQNSPYTLMMAGAMVALLPTLILFVFAQKYFIEGIVTTGLK